MTLHKTLLRQITKYLGSADAIAEEMKGLFVVISDTYTHFDEDRALIERSLEISSKELREVISQLQATLESTKDGILVVNREGKITGYNKRFVSMWRIPQDVMATHDDDKAIAFVLDQLKYPDIFVEKVRELYGKPEAEGDDLLEFKDGRVFERSTLPQRVGTSVIGRIWSFHDVSERVKGEQTLQKKVTELGRLNQFMVDRELKMVELKKKIEAQQKELGHRQQAE